MSAVKSYYIKLVGMFCHAVTACCIQIVILYEICLTASPWCINFMIILPYIYCMQKIIAIQVVHDRLYLKEKFNIDLYGQI